MQQITHYQIQATAPVKAKEEFHFEFLIDEIICPIFWTIS